MGFGLYHCVQGETVVVPVSERELLTYDEIGQCVELRP